MAAMDASPVRTSVRTAVRYVRMHPTHVLLALALLYIAASSECASCAVGLVSLVWWHSYYLRETIKYTLMMQVAYFCVQWMWTAARWIWAVSAELCCLCRRKTAGARLRESLARNGCRSVEWQCGSIWTPDASPAFRTAMASDTIQRDAAGVVWRRAMCSERAAIEIFNYDDTPPQSRHPTPAQDLEHMHVA